MLISHHQYNWQELVVNHARRDIVLSPHYDDLVLSLGGLALHWQQQKNIVEDWVVFPFGNYIAADRAMYTDFSDQRVNMVSRQRHREELSATAALGIKTVKQLGCYEAMFRGHSDFMAPSQRAYPWTTDDLQALRLINEAVAPLLDQPVNLFVPLAMQGHYDHILVREAVCGLLANRHHQLAASILFYEDMPYAAESTQWQWWQMHWMMRRWKLQPIIIPIDAARKVDLLLQHYPSQFNPSYEQGIVTRSRFLQRQYRLDTPAERIFMVTRGL